MPPIPEQNSIPQLFFPPNSLWCMSEWVLPLKRWTDNLFDWSPTLWLVVVTLFSMCFFCGGAVAPRLWYTATGHSKGDHYCAEHGCKAKLLFLFPVVNTQKRGRYLYQATNGKHSQQKPVSLFWNQVFNDHLPQSRRHTHTHTYLLLSHYTNITLCLAFFSNHHGNCHCCYALRYFRSGEK